MSQEQPLRPWLEQHADRIERLCEAHRLWVRVQGGVVTPRLVRFDLLLDPRIPIKRISALQEDLALTLDAPSARLVIRASGFINTSLRQVRLRSSSLPLR